METDQAPAEKAGVAADLVQRQQPCMAVKGSVLDALRIQRGRELTEPDAELVGVEGVGADRVDLLAQRWRALQRTRDGVVECGQGPWRSSERPVHLELAPHVDQGFAQPRSALGRRVTTSIEADAEQVGQP